MNKRYLPTERFCTRNMDSSGRFNGRYAPNDAPVFFTMAHQKGAKASQENKAGRKTKGQSEGSTLKGKVRQWSGVGGTGKESDGENRHPLHYTTERYAEGVNGVFDFVEEKKEEAKTEQAVLESTCSN